MTSDAVIPAQAGIQKPLGPRLRGDDDPSCNVMKKANDEL